MGHERYISLRTNKSLRRRGTLHHRAIEERMTLAGIGTTVAGVHLTRLDAIAALGPDEG